MTPGTRQAFLPGGHRTGTPGKHVVRGKAKYRLLDENVRFFVAPPVEEISGSPVRLACHHLGVWPSHGLTRIRLASTICRPQRSAHQWAKARDFRQASKRRHEW
jgi:hypothetical protein